MKRILHLILPVLIFCSTVKITNAQYVTIPDTNFVNWLNANGYSQCMNGNQMDTTCNAVVSAKSLNFQYSNIVNTDGVQYFDSLITLDLTHNWIDVIPNLPPLLEYLYCRYVGLDSLAILPESLNYLSCEGNFLLSALPNLPAALETLICYQNNLTTLPNLPVNLYRLECEINKLTSLPPLPSGLSILRCSNNLLTSLPQLSDSLSILFCSGNLLTALPALPLNLKQLQCGYNQLTTLPTLPASLVTLDCSSNQLSNLPVLPTQLINLGFSNNNISSFQPLPLTLQYLSCDNNGISNLQTLPSTLRSLSCTNNQLTNLPSFPTGVTNLYCSNNLLTSLPELPDTMSELFISGNPFLTCLPKINFISYFHWDSTGINCFSNYMKIQFSAVPPINSVPLCDPFNVNACPFYWNIDGAVYIDTNANCIQDTNEALLKNVKLKLFENGNLIQETFTNDDGKFLFDTDSGSYSLMVDTTGLPFSVMCPIGFIDSVYVPSNDSVVFDRNFGLGCVAGFDIGVNAIVRDSGLVRPANFFRVHVLAGEITNKYGLHCAGGVSGTVQVVMSGNATYIGPAVNALTPIVNGDTLLYTIADFGNVNFYSDFGIVMQTDTTAQAGNQICFDISVTPTNGDNVATNNFLTHCFTVVNSYDPNLKSVYPAEILDDKNGKLTYTIQFQNTGTATAQHIYIMDTLDANLDVSSFELLAYSVQPVVQIIGNVARFNFPNINLPDSNSNEPGSHGFVQFRIKLKDGLQLHTAISNTSYIYFDFNSPVQTNTVADTLLDCDLVVSAFNISQTSFCKDDTLFANVSLNDDAIVNWYLDNVLIATDTNITTPNIGLGNHILKTEVITYYCTKEISTPIVFHDLPAINLGNDTTTCNVAVPLDAGSGFMNYLWNNGSTTQIIVASLSLPYSVTVGDSNSCVNNDVINITINPLPQIELGNDTSACNIPVLLDAGAGYVNYLWNNGATTQIISANLSSLYSVAVIDSNGCKNNDSISITINPLPTVELGIDTSTCNVPLQLDAGAGNISYQWSNGETTQSIVANSSSLYGVIVSDANGCSNSDSISIIINPLPVVSFTAFSQDTICLTHGIQTINNGNPPGGILSGTGVSGNTFDPTIAGVGLHYITYEFTDSLGCSNKVTDSVFVDLCLGVNVTQGNNEIKIYPNPTTNLITIVVGEKNTNHRQLSLFIYDLLGNQLKIIQLNQQKTVLDISDLAAGNYLLKIFDRNDLLMIQKLVKMSE